MNSSASNIKSKNRSFKQPLHFSLTFSPGSSSSSSAASSSSSTASSSVSPSYSSYSSSTASSSVSPSYSSSIPLPVCTFLPSKPSCSSMTSIFNSAYLYKN